MRAAAVAVAAALAAIAAHGGATAKGGGFGQGKYGLELDNVKCGWVSEVEGGSAVGEVVTEKVGADNVVRKHIGTLKYEDISFKVGGAGALYLYDWIRTAFDPAAYQAKKGGRRDGAIIFADYDYKELSRLEFFGAGISSVTLPALDASGKEPCAMTVTARPEATVRQKGTGAVYSPGELTKGESKKEDKQAAKQWLPSNFRLKIEGIGDVTPGVLTIGELTVKRGSAGTGKDYELEATSVEVPNLVITLAESHAQPFYDWHESFVIEGKNPESLERSATLQYLATDGSVLFTLQFAHLGIFKVGPDKMEAGSEGVRRVKAELYCEVIEFTFSPSGG